jgi:hypothetical protein
MNHLKEKGTNIKDTHPNKPSESQGMSLRNLVNQSMDFHVTKHDIFCECSQKSFNLSGGRVKSSFTSHQDS